MEAVAIKGERCELTPLYLIGGSQSQTGEDLGACVGVFPPVEAERKRTKTIHWLRGSVDHKDLHRLAEDLTKIWGSEPEVRKWGFWSYDRSLWWPVGMTLCYHSSDDRYKITKGRITIEINGKALDLLDEGQLELLIVKLAAYQIECTRIDLAYDDYERLIEPHRLWADVVEWTGERSRLHLRGFRRAGHHVETISKRAMDEAIFGRRGDCGSGKFLRIYDKRLESKGEIDCIRYEVELSADHARVAFIKLYEAIFHSACGEVETMADELGRIIGGAIDFIQKTDKNLDRGTRFPWWAKIMESLGRDILRVKRPATEVLRSRAWLTTQTIRTFKMVGEAMGKELWLESFLKIMSSTRLCKKHEAAIAAYRKQLEETGQNPDYIKLRQWFTDHDIDIDADEDNAEDHAENFDPTYEQMGLYD